MKRITMAEEKANGYISNSSLIDAHAYNSNYGAHQEGMTKEAVADYYTRWALKGTYEKDLGPERYRGYMYAAEAVSGYFLENRENVKILDVAAGSGFLGEKLFEKRFRNIDGLDPSQGMLDMAREKGVYRELLCQFMDGEVSNIDSDIYDCVVVSGGMGEGHIPCAAISEMARIVKAGGLVCIVMREEYIGHVKEYNGRLEPMLEELETDGKWELISRKVVPKYSFDNNGIVYQYRVL